MFIFFAESIERRRSQSEGSGGAEVNDSLTVVSTYFSAQEV